MLVIRRGMIPTREPLFAFSVRGHEVLPSPPEGQLEEDDEPGYSRLDHHSSKEYSTKWHLGVANITAILRCMIGR